MAHTDRDIMRARLKRGTDGYSDGYRYGARVPDGGRGMLGRSYNRNNRIYWDDDSGNHYPHKYRRRVARHIEERQWRQELRAA